MIIAVWTWVRQREEGHQELNIEIVHKISFESTFHFIQCISKNQKVTGKFQTASSGVLENFSTNTITFIVMLLHKKTTKAFLVHLVCN